MCGITGFLNFKGVPVDRNRLVDVTNSIEHRGHDSADVRVGVGVGAGAGGGVGATTI